MINSCKNNPTYSDKQSVLIADRIVKIEFKRPKNCQSDFVEFEISDKNMIRDFISELNKAPLDGPWKGACWNTINLLTKDTTYILSTNDKVFGIGSNGMFYRLPKEGIINEVRNKIIN
jgi:hypothetical protein